MKPRRLLASRYLLAPLQARKAYRLAWPIAICAVLFGMFVGMKIISLLVSSDTRDFIFAFIAISSALGILISLLVIRRHQKIRLGIYSPRRTQSPQPPSLNALVHFADWWGLDLRKRIKAIAGDYDAEIRRLCCESRYLTARWNKVLAWTFAFWYIGRGPLDWIRALLLLAVKGK